MDVPSFNAGYCVGDRFEIRRLLGSGGMANVYLAWDLRLHREIALKTIRIDRAQDPKRADTLRKRLLREAQSAARLSHPGIVIIHDIGEIQDFPYISMEYIQGMNLRHFMEKHTAIPLSTLLTITRQVASALDYAHENGVIHRDIKPENIMITPNLVVKITDFGIARMETPHLTTLTSEGKLVCTYHYTAPEYFQGQKGSFKGDIFSFGCVIYELVTGRFAFRGETEPQIWWRIVHGEPDSPRSIIPALPPAVDSAILGMLAKQPEDRPDSCIRAFENFQESLLGTPPDTPFPMTAQLTSPQKATPPAGRLPDTISDSLRFPEHTRVLNRRKTKWLWVMIGIGTGILGALILYYTGQNFPDPDTKNPHELTLPIDGIATATPGKMIGVGTRLDEEPERVNIPVSSSGIPTLSSEESIPGGALVTPSGVSGNLARSDTPAPVPDRLPETETSMEPKIKDVRRSEVPRSTAAPSPTSAGAVKRTPVPSPTPTGTPAGTSSPSPEPTDTPTVIPIPESVVAGTNTVIPEMTGTPLPSGYSEQNAVVENRADFMDRETVIRHTVPKVVRQGDDMVLRVVVSGQREIEKIVIRMTSKKGSFDGVMSVVRGREFEGVIPSKRITGKTIGYQFEVMMKDGGVIWSEKYTVVVREPWVPF